MDIKCIVTYNLTPNLQEWIKLVYSIKSHKSSMIHVQIKLDISRVNVEMLKVPKTKLFVIQIKLSRIKIICFKTLYTATLQVL